MIEVGDFVTRKVNFDKGFSKTMRGQVVYIHPERRFYDVVFKSDKGFAIRESYHFEYSEMLAVSKQKKGIGQRKYEREEETAGANTRG